MHVFVDDLDEPAFADEDRHHVVGVRRLRPGDPLSASDGAGRWRACRLSAGGGLETCGEVIEVPAPQPALTIGFALTKGTRPELSVQKLTELGIDRIVPFVGGRSVVRWEGERGERALQRLRRVARQAAMQCGRVHLPEVAEAGGFTQAAQVASSGGQIPVEVALACAGGPGPSLEYPAVLVGPEGGWAEDELAQGLPRVGLGPLVLRAETAAMAAAVLLSGLRAHLVGPGRG